ncbi:VQ motif [Musa troglodytarum]|uniref:VQ motif n=1 Tax=Musa troglodytarum TaxID=320322 RepID=A0A9E7G6V7_9LILI|nr:VQ motif [Musa troglodytarum]
MGYQIPRDLSRTPTQCPSSASMPSSWFPSMTTNTPSRLLHATKRPSMEKPCAGSAAQECTAPSTTFVQADAATFKELVQRLTGPHERDGAHRPVDAAVAPAPPSFPTKLSGLKRLPERRQRSRPKLTILKPGSTSKPPSPAVLSPSVTGASASPSADFAGLNICEQKGVDGADELDEEEEERAIKERRFYLHPSPRSRSRNAEPELLPLFPLTSPKSFQS